MAGPNPRLRRIPLSGLRPQLQTIANHCKPQQTPLGSVSGNNRKPQQTTANHRKLPPVPGAFLPRPPGILLFLLLILLLPKPPETPASGSGQPLSTIANHRQLPSGLRLRQQPQTTANNRQPPQTPLRPPTTTANHSKQPPTIANSPPAPFAVPLDFRPSPPTLPALSSMAR